MRMKHTQYTKNPLLIYCVVVDFLFLKKVYMVITYDYHIYEAALIFVETLLECGEPQWQLQATT